MIDKPKLADLPRDRPLTATDSAVGYTCVICGCRQEPYAWRVYLPRRKGPACTGCAGDAGFTVK